jgi:hypothetical protein
VSFSILPLPTRPPPPPSYRAKNRRAEWGAQPKPDAMGSALGRFALALGLAQLAQGPLALVA